MSQINQRFSWTESNDRNHKKWKRAAQCEAWSHEEGAAESASESFELSYQRVHPNTGSYCNTTNTRSHTHTRLSHPKGIHNHLTNRKKNEKETLQNTQKGLRVHSSVLSQTQPQALDSPYILHPLSSAAFSYTSAH